MDPWPLFWITLVACLTLALCVTLLCICVLLSVQRWCRCREQLAAQQQPGQYLQVISYPVEKKI